MKLEDQVCSKELSIRLKELGVKQENTFWWRVGTKDEFSDKPTYFPFEKYEKVIKQRIDDGHGWPKISALTVAELGEMLPERYMDRVWQHISFSKITDNNRGHMIVIKNGSGETTKIFVDSVEANVRAKMLIHLLENKLVTCNPKPATRNPKPATQ